MRTRVSFSLRLAPPTAHAFPPQAQVSQYNYILVAGDREVERSTVTPRLRDGTVLPEVTVDELSQRLHAEAAAFE